MFNQQYLFSATFLYGLIATFLENHQSPGHLITVDGKALHLWHVRSNEPTAHCLPTVVIEHSLGGVEGYLNPKPIESTRFNR